MKNKSKEPRGEEEIRNENEFLKMKLMLEQGAVFGAGDHGDLPPDVENEFLKHIVEFEKQAANPVRTTVFEKIGRPDFFPKVQTIANDQIEEAWEKLNDYLMDHGVSLDCCSPNVDDREMYRFATEELFKLEVSDINIPGMICGFIYDEFYPDHKYQNTREAVDDIIGGLFEKEEMLLPPWILEEKITFNKFENITIEEFVRMCNQFKEMYDKIELVKSESNSCEIVGNTCIVSGFYEAELFYGGNKDTPRGDWTVEYTADEPDRWMISRIKIDGVFTTHL